ncbi:MAG: choice-of-anchor A family protein, partial [Methanobacteriota archaeon]
IGDFVWNDANGNGLQESGEFGVGNITVYLLDSNGDTVQTTTTNGNGYYQFTNVAPGTYTVEFDIPSNYAFSPKDQGSDDTKDSDANPNGITDPFTVNHGDNNTTIDAGIKEIPLQPATIGDMVWNDLDHDGVQDQGETGYSGVTVKLFTCAGALKNVTTTDANGHYSFTIPANELGDYYVEFVLPQGYMFSPKDNATGNNADEIDSDADANGKTDCITINSGSTNDTWDAGIYEIPATSDLSLTKSVSNTTPNDGDQITYTVTVTNHGPADATGVEVTDILPDGLVFVSATASAGNYVDSTGIWTVGSIAANSNATLEITAKVDVQSCITGTIDLGPATGFNLFVWRDFKAPSSDVEGKVAVGRDAELSNYSIADKLNGSYSSDDVFIVNRDLYFTSGRVYYGNATYGRATNLPKQNVTIDGSLRKDRPIDFAAAKAYLKNLSTTLSNYAVNGNTTYQWSGVFLEGNDPYLNVFEVSGTELTNSTYMDIKVPNGSVVLVNVDGKHITWNGGLTVTGTSITNVLYNFHKARTLNISGIDVRGSILAPFANVTFNSGLISGQLIAKSMFGNGQINNYPFVGNVPCPSEIVNVAEISAADQGDPDSTPGNGDANEDDYASVTINIGTTSGGGSGGGNGGGSGSGDNGNWDVASQFPFQEIVWTMANDASGNMLAGTIGGHLFISYDDGANWTQINENLIVGFIW